MNFCSLLDFVFFTCSLAIESLDLDVLPCNGVNESDHVLTEKIPLRRHIWHGLNTQQFTNKFPYPYSIEFFTQF